MVGHGGPRKALAQFVAGIATTWAGQVQGLWIALFFCAAWSMGWPVVAKDLDLRLRIDWGEGTPHRWTGVWQLSSGRFADIQRLGYEANAPTAIANSGNTLRIWQPAQLSYDGLDVRVVAPEDAKLTLQMMPDDNAAEEQTITFELSQFALELGYRPVLKLDEAGNRLIARRAPGDHLRVEFDRDSLVFAPGEDWTFEVRPHRLGQAAGTQLRCTLQLVGTRNANEYWSEQHDLTFNELGDSDPIGPIALTLPTEEGVFELVVTLRERKFKAPVLLQRKVQLLIIDGQLQPVAEAADWREVEKVAPSVPAWWRKSLAWLPQWKIAGGARGPVDTGLVTQVARAGQTLTQLGPGGWQAAPLPIARAGVPHILEVEYPMDETQTLGISIVETDASGRVSQLGLDSGVDVVRGSLPAAPGFERHRLLFWPRTKSPWLLLTNRRDAQPARFASIRVLAGPTRLPPSVATQAQIDGRWLAAYFDKPLFAQNFSAAEAFDELPQRSLHDWQTFYEGGERLVEYLQYVGYNAAIISVARDGGTIYPTKLLDATPRYDSGVFFLSGQDPRQKDVLEMLFRLFDREGLKLAPALHLSTPLRELEEAKRRDPAAAVGIELIGKDGRPWPVAQGTNRGQAPFYNPLDPRVQAAIRKVVNEIVDRYGQHPSFAGVSLQLGPETYVQMPGLAWGNDDRTAARFNAETGNTLSIEGRERFAQRHTALLTAEVRKPWLAWRSQKLLAFYNDLHDSLRRTKADAKLYLAAGELVGGSLMQDALRPKLPPRADLSDAFLQHGLDVPRLNQLESIVLLCPQRWKPVTQLVDQAALVQLRDAHTLDALFADSKHGGTLNFHEPMTLELPSFDAVSPFGAGKTRILLAPEILPSGVQNRARFIHSLAQNDSLLLVEGGRMLPLGQEDAVRRQLEAYRWLPPARFQDVPPPAPDAAPSSVVIRSLTRGDRTYFYVVNDAPWGATAEIHLRLPAQTQVQRFGSTAPEELAASNGLQIWTVSLEPYDLVSAYASAPQAEVVRRQIEYDRDVKASLTPLVQDVKTRVNELRTHKPLAVIDNAGFEAANADGTPAGWEICHTPGATIRLDGQQAFQGNFALHMKMTANETAWVRSARFAAPKTGRLSLLAWVRTRDAQQQPQLRLSIDDGRQGFYTFAPLGKEPDRTGKLRENIQQLGTQWPTAPYLFHYDKLPASGLDQITIGFDLVGPGEVWIDDVQVFDLYFFDSEVTELLRNAATAHFQIDGGRVADGERFLESYWSRYVLEHVPAPVLAEVPREPVAARAARALPNSSGSGTENNSSSWQRYLPKWKMPFKR